LGIDGYCPGEIKVFVMNKSTLTLALLFIGGAFAFAGPEALPSGKEMKEVAPAPAPTCDYSWTGFYLGVNVGYGWGNADTRFEFLPSEAAFDALNEKHDADPDGVIGGGQIGFNWEWNKWLILGVETDFQGSDMNGSKTSSPVLDSAGAPLPFPTALFTRERTDWFGTFRGRIGFSPWCRLLVYGTGGLAYGDVHYTGDGFFNPGLFFQEFTSHSRTNVGWTAGGGLEYALTRHWSIKAEYLYYDLGDHGSTGNETVNGLPNPPFGIHYNWETQANIVRGGINYKF
jgi:outer membrane immunogenic protein